MSLAFADTVTTKTAPMPARVRAISQSELPPLVTAIDEGHYPADFMRAIGAAGAYASHTDARPGLDLNPAIAAMGEVSEVCGSSGFMTWCQDTLVWYVANTANDELKERLLATTASGDQLGGTGLSNPMKSFFGIEKLKLKGRRVEGGYVVRGALPWVSNLGEDHVFGTVFEREDGEKVMFIADCADPAIELLPCDPFLAMDGTGTYGIHFKDTFVPDSLVLAHEAMPFIKKIRAGFVLLQMGMAIGLTRDCIAQMKRVRPSLGHVNKFLVTQQPEQFEEALEALTAEVNDLAAQPYETSASFWRRVVQARLDAGDLTMAAAHASMLHAGARGYLKSSPVQRRVREAYFVGIVTPATKQLRKMLAEMN